MGLNKSIYKWTEPKPTKSGRDVIDIWNDLKDVEQKFKTARLEDNLDDMVNNAVLIQAYQSDLGLTVTGFPFLSEKDNE